MKYRMKKRKWLNDDPASRAFVIAAVENTKGRKVGEDGDDRFYPTLEIGDCVRSISLDFSLSLYGEEAKQSEYDKLYKKNLKKVARFRSIINEFCDAIVEEVLLHKSRAPQRKAAIEKSKKAKKERKTP